MSNPITRVIFWTYTRGSWQYDLMCLVILLFIFLTPVHVFDGSAFEEKSEQPATQIQQDETVGRPDETGEHPTGEDSHP